MNAPLISDQELVSQYIKGRESALSKLIERHKEKIYSTIFFYVKNTALAEDIFQDTFIKVIDTLRSGKYQEEGKFRPWVLRIAHNLCIDYFRKVKRTPTVTNSEGFDIFDVLHFSNENAEDKMIKEQMTDKMKKLIDQLPPEQKEVVIYRHYADLSFKEISDLTGVSINTALGRMRYALQNLRKLIEEHSITM